MKTGQKSDLLGNNSRCDYFRAVFVLPFPRMEPTSNIHQLIAAEILHTSLSECSPYLYSMLLPLGVPLFLTIGSGAT
jgi:hypothetical protein